MESASGPCPASHVSTDPQHPSITDTCPRGHAPRLVEVRACGRSRGGEPLASPICSPIGPDFPGTRMPRRTFGSRPNTMSSGTRILNPALSRLDHVGRGGRGAYPSGAMVGMSGLTGAGYPKAVPQALTRRIMDADLAGSKFRISVWTGASTAPSWMTPGDGRGHRVAVAVSVRPRPAAGASTPGRWNTSTST